MSLTTTDWSVYLISGPPAAGDRTLAEIVRAAVRGGVTAVQLREKHAPVREVLELGRSLLEVTRPAGIPLIVNDRVDVALALGADGVHLGQDDMPFPDARRLLGPERIIGLSAGTVLEARRAEEDGADYLGVGDVFGTPTKSDAGPPIGLSGLREIVHAVTIPVVAIGGVTSGNAASTIESGAAGVAVVSAIINAADPEAAARSLSENVRRAHH